MARREHLGEHLAERASGDGGDWLDRVPGSVWRLPGSQYRWSLRCPPFIVTLFGLGLLIAYGSRSEDYGLFRQYIEWPAVALFVGRALEPLATSLGRPRRTAAGLQAYEADRSFF